MKINKLIRDKHKISRSTDGVSFRDISKDENLNESEIFKIIDDRIIQAIKTHVRKDSNFDDFLRDKITLFKLLEKTINYEKKMVICTKKYHDNWTGKNKDKINWDPFEDVINAFFEYERLCKIISTNDGEKLEPFEKFYVPEILNAIEKKFGKNFLNYVGSIFNNKDCTISEIKQNPRSYVNVTMKSLLGNKIQNERNFLSDDVFDSVFCKVENNLFKNKIEYIIEECSNCKSRDDELELQNVKKYVSMRKYRNDVSDKIMRMVISEVKDYFFNKSKDYDEEKKTINSYRKRLVKMVSNDLRYHFKYDDKNLDGENINKVLVKIINEKIKTIKKVSLNSVNMEHYYTPENGIFTDEHKIISHSIFKLFKNLSVIVGSNIINFNLGSNSEFKDFSSQWKKDLIDKYLRSYPENTIFNDWRKEFNIDYLGASMYMRNMVIHQKKFGETNENEDNHINKNDGINLDKMVQTICTMYNSRQSKILENYAITDDKNSKLKIYDRDDYMVSIQFKKIFKKSLKIKESENKNRGYFQTINLMKEIHEGMNSGVGDSNLWGAKKYLLKKVYNCNFQDWLLYCKKTFVVKDFTKWYISVSETKNKNVNLLKFPTFNDCSYLDAQKSFDEYLSKWSEKSSEKDKQESLKKRKSLVEYFTLYCFGKFINDNGYILESFNTSELKCNLVKVKNDETIDKPIKAIVASSLNLSNYQLSKLINIFDNFKNRIYKNDDIKETYEEYYEKGKWYFNYSNIKTINKYLKMLIEINENINIIDSTDNKLPDILESNGDENYIENSSNKQYKLLQSYADGETHREILTKLNVWWKKNNKTKINVFNENPIVPDDETKVQKINRTKISNLSNGQAIINSLKLIEEVNYWSVRWAMYREFYNNNKSKKNDNIQYNIQYNIKSDLNEILHFNIDKKKNGIIPNLILITNKIREIHNGSRNNKNMITPSLTRLFERYNLVIDFTFNDHCIDSFSIKSKCINLDGQNVALVSDEEIEIYNAVLSFINII